ncbi:unnamed protein product [Caenorhabditis bovis]|uniref:Cyclin-dependent kinase 12 n=1 Tax=Caenorhabditis bovis TaxID=2654633 RepID=A0A8S1ETH9_9PELO|nr:unnamed protein product [Caenorhabditis bovis]
MSSELFPGIVVDIKDFNAQIVSGNNRFQVCRNNEFEVKVGDNVYFDNLKISTVACKTVAKITNGRINDDEMMWSPYIGNIEDPQSISVVLSDDSFYEVIVSYQKENQVYWKLESVVKLRNEYAKEIKNAAEMSFDSPNEGSLANFENDGTNGSSHRRKEEEISPAASSNDRDRRASNSYRERDRSRSRTTSPSRMYNSKNDRKSSSRQGKRDRVSRDDRSPSTPIRNRRSNSREGRSHRYRDDRNRGDRWKSKERFKRRDKKRSRSRSRHRSPKRSKKNRRRYSSASNSPDPMSISLIGEIKKTHGDTVVSKSRKKRRKHKRHSSSSSTSSEEMHVDGPASSNGTALNIPAPMPPPQILYQYQRIAPQPAPPTSFYPVNPPPLPPTALMDPYQKPPPVLPSMPPPATASYSTDGLFPQPPQPTVQPHLAFSGNPGVRMMEGLPLPPAPESKRIVTKPVVLNRRGNRRKVDPSRDEWGTTLLTDYTMLGQIGEGTYGQVYKAVNKKTGEQVALKRVRLENEKEGFPITAVREIKILRQLNHKNIVRLIDIVTDNASVQELLNFYLVFEYVDHDLMGLLDSKDLIEFTKEQVCMIFKQLLEGLAYCHQAGFLHRDIKCSNILVNNKGELKVADLGLARLWHEGYDRPYTNRVITLWYRPPELLLGEECYGPEIDIWSAGCMLGELFTRKPLFNGSNDIAQLEVITKLCGSPTIDNWPDVVKLKGWQSLRQKRAYPRRIRDEFEHIMPSQAVDLLDKLLSLDPKKRLTAREALNHPWILSLKRTNVPPLNLPQHQDCHEMWSKKQKRENRLLNGPSASKTRSPGGSSGHHKLPNLLPRGNSRPSNGASGSQSISRSASSSGNFVAQPAPTAAAAPNSFIH